MFHLVLNLASSNTILAFFSGDNALIFNVERWLTIEWRQRACFMLNFFNISAKWLSLFVSFAVVFVGIFALKSPPGWAEIVMGVVNSCVVYLSAVGANGLAAQVDKRVIRPQSAARRRRAFQGWFEN